jgi:hypothetical protein
MGAMLNVLLSLAITAPLLAGALSPEASKAVASVAAAYEQVEAEQSKLPPTTNDRERLERLAELDQAGRTAFQGPAWSAVPKNELAETRKAAFEIITKYDLADQAALKSMMPPDGWFRMSKYGQKANLAAFLIVQHAVNDPGLMRSTLTKMQPLIALGEVRGADYALLYDRVALEFDHKQQRYGSQIGCRDGHPQPHDLEDPAHVDERRKAIGFKDTEAEYLQNFQNMRCG